MFKQVAFAFIVLLVLASSAAGTTYYTSPAGSDKNNGTAREAPLQTFAHAVPKLTSGDTLVLLDGTYTLENSGYMSANCSKNANSGTAGAPITVTADHERRAWIKGDGSATPFILRNCSYWNVEGVRASSADYPDGGDNVFSVLYSNHVELRRLLLHHNNRYENSDCLQITMSHHVVVEEVEAYFFHRHGISAYKSDHITIRRSYVNGRNATDLEAEEAWGSHGCCTKGGDEGFAFYFTSNSILENSISTHSEQLSIISGVETVLGNPGGQYNKVLGSISYKDLRPGFLQSRKFKDQENRPYTGPAKNIVYRDYLIVGGQQIDRGAAFAPIVGQDVTIDGATWYKFEKHTPIFASPDTRELSTRFFLGCDRPEVGGCDYDVLNTLFLNNGFYRTGSLLYAPDRNELDFLAAYSNAWNDEEPGRGFGVAEDISDADGQYRHSMAEEPTKMGLGADECIVFVPERSNMSGAGKDGSDIGANILYRFEDGQLTDQPLWDPETGAFPHGAVIETGPNDPDEHDMVLADIHEHLNVNTNGCTLPYAASASSAVRELPDEDYLRSNYPNPFNPETKIQYGLPEPNHVKLTIYDVLGRQIRHLVDRRQPAGRYEVRFVAENLSSGIYLYHLSAGSFTDTGMMSLVK
jgi:hypothetical protein